MLCNMTHFIRLFMYIIYRLWITFIKLFDDMHFIVWLLCNFSYSRVFKEYLIEVRYNLNSNYLEKPNGM